VQLQFAFPSIWRMSSKQNTKQHTFAQSYVLNKQDKIWYKNIRAFLSYHNFYVYVFFVHPLNTRLNIFVQYRDFILEIRFVERGVCPIATLYSLAAAFLLREPSYNQLCPKIRCHGNAGSRGEIQMAPSDSAGQKIGGRCKQGTIICHGGRVVVNFVPRFVAMTTGVGRGEISTTSSNSPDPKIERINANSAQLSFTGTELYRFEISIGCNAKFCNF